MPTNTSDRTTVAILGSGPSGLACALTLSRSMVETIVISSDGTAPRNTASPFVAALPGMDRNSPAEVRAAIRKDILSYPFARFRNSDATALQNQASGFQLDLSDGSSVFADKVLLAMGMVDIYPDVANLADYWGSSIINCPFCHGYEWRNTRWGIYADRQEVLDAAEVYRHWSNELTYFIDPSLHLTEERRTQFESLGISICEALPVAVNGTGGSLTEAVFSDQQPIAIDCMLVFPFQKQTKLVTALDLQLTSDGYVGVDEGFRTSVSGIYAAGDITYAGHQNTPTALHMGNMAAATIVMDLCFKK